ncbi:MAG: ATP-binding protein [Myxococcota bacterium]
MKARHVVIEVIFFLVATGGVMMLYNAMNASEEKLVKQIVARQAERIDLILANETKNKLSSLKRMGQRWEAAGGIPKDLWFEDAKNYINSITGLKKIERLGIDHAVIWSISSSDQNEQVPVDETALSNAAQLNRMVMTAPLEVAPHQKGFILYVPLKINGQNDGFFEAVFYTDEFFKHVVIDSLADWYEVKVSYQGNTVFENKTHDSLEKNFSVSQTLRWYDDQWLLTLIPTKSFIDSNFTRLPLVVLLGGILVVILICLAFHAMSVSRWRAKRLGQLNRFNEDIMSSAVHLIIATDLDGKIQVFNRAAESTLGYQADEVIGRLTPAIWHDKEEIVKRAAELSEEMGRFIPPGPEVFTFKTIQEGVESREWTFIRKDGSKFPGNLIMTARRNEKGGIIGYLGVIENISAHKEAERIKSEFISIISHELRTPLTSIRGSLGIVLGDSAKELPPKISTLLQIANKNCERLILLINDILDIDKIAAGKMRFDMQDVSLADITKQAVQVNQAYAERLNVRIELAPLDESIRVVLDPDRYVQVLSNLLSNAAKFSPSGGQIEVLSAVEDSKVRIYVQDHGPGIPEEFQSKIFGKFSQADSSDTRAKEGTGLGLHISKQIVSKMNGNIGFDTEPGKGTTFWIEFERLQYTAGAETSLPRILHIEDDIDFTRIISLALNGTAELVRATSLRQAEYYLRKQHFDLIILDVGMPDGSGIDLLDQLDSIVSEPLPVVILSADTVMPEVQRQVAASIVKAKMSEAKIIDIIKNILKERV